MAPTALVSVPGAAVPKVEVFREWFLTVSPFYSSMDWPIDVVIEWNLAEVGPCCKKQACPGPFLQPSCFWDEITVHDFYCDVLLYFAKAMNHMIKD